MDINQQVPNTSTIRSQITKNADGSLDIPETIISTVTAARGLFAILRTEHLPRIAFFASLEGLLGGNPPFDQEEIDAAGLGHIANFNNLDARSLYERSALALWNLIYQSTSLVSITITNPNFPTEDLRKFERILEEEFTYVVKKWPSFTTIMSTNMAQIIKIGVSCLLWTDERDWRPTTIEYTRFYVPNQAQVDMDKLTFCFLESIFTVQDLYLSYKFSIDNPDDTSWDAVELGRYLVERANSFLKPTRPFLDVADIQSRVQAHEYSWGQVFTDNVTLVSLLYREYDNKVSHMIFDPFYYTNVDFLYRSPNQYNSMDDALVIFTASPGEFTIHSNRGVGHKIYAGSQATMQLDCAIVDAGRWASTPIISNQVGGTNSTDPIRFIQGVPTNIGTSTFQQNNIGANIGYLVNLSQYISSKIQANIVNSGDDPAYPDRDAGSKSPTEVRQTSFREFGVQKNNIQHFYEGQDRTVRNMANRMLESKENFPANGYAQAWKDRCIARGVPKELFNVGKKKTPWGSYVAMEIESARVAGDGSTLGLITMLQEVAPAVGEFSAKGERMIAELWVIATFGPKYVDEFLPQSDTEDAQSNGASLAGVENGIMLLGQSPIFSQDNDHRSHVVTHMPMLQHIIQQVQQQQMDPVQADKTFSQGIPHTQEHLQALTRMPYAKSFMEKITPLWKEVEKYAQNNRQNAVKMVQAQIRQKQQNTQATQTVMSDAQRKDFVAKADVARADQKVSSQIDRAQEASQTRAQIMETEANAKAANKRHEINLSAENDAAANSSPDQSDSIDSQSLPELHSDLSNMIGNTPSNFDFEPPQ